MPAQLPQQVSPVEAARLLNEGEAALLDVREPNEWAAGHAPQATHVPMGELTLESIPAGSPLLVVCHLGGRSMQATVALRRNGIDAVNVAGGMDAWEAAGLPVVAGAGSDEGSETDPG